MASALDIYFSSLVRAAESATGAPLRGGTVIAPEADRRGSLSATSYPTPAGTIVWCDPALVDTLEKALDGATATALDSEEFVRLAIGAGATLTGFGNNRVLGGDLRRLQTRSPVDDVRRVDGATSMGRAWLSELESAVSVDDRDEADLVLDDLDPFIVGLFVGDRLVAYGSSRPSEIDERFDDIAVLTHPEHRRHGLGSAAVTEFVRHRLAADPERLLLYRCQVDNGASNALAESLGFTLAHTIGAVRFTELTTN